MCHVSLLCICIQCVYYVLLSTTVCVVQVVWSAWLSTLGHAPSVVELAESTNLHALTDTASSLVDHFVPVSLQVCAAAAFATVFFGTLIGFTAATAFITSFAFTIAATAAATATFTATAKLMQILVAGLVSSTS